MATRGIIGKVVGTGFFARYHHWDSYPSGLGAALYQLYQGYFKRDMAAMLTVLIDEHPAGWSTINDRDFSLAPGWTDMNYSGESWNSDSYAQQIAQYELSDDGKRPQCYCHGGRQEEAKEIRSWTDASNFSAEYAYILNGENSTMAIHERSLKVWSQIAVVDLNAPEPDWNMET